MLIHFQWVFGGGRVVSKHSLEPQVKPRCLEDLIKIANVVIIKVFVGGGLFCLVGLGFFLDLRIIIFIFLITVFQILVWTYY